MSLLPLLSQLILQMFLCQDALASETEQPQSAPFDALNTLAKYLRYHETYLHQKMLTDGNSGIKQIRLNKMGTKTYFSTTHSMGRNMVALHNHANHYKTVGLGEFTAVLNGVEFRTRHNDYSLSMPSKTSTKFHEVEEIPYPEVPPSVLEKEILQEQIEEMRAYFRAFHNQNKTDRDYHNYFKPVLCYLEGAYVYTNSTGIDGFFSDRHAIDANNIEELTKKVRFNSMSGRKSQLENFAYLPTSIVGMDEDGMPITAQWNYRIMCHSLKNELMVNRLRPVDEITNRMINEYPWQKYAHSMAARFQLNQDNTDVWSDRPSTRGYLDELMEEIPGADNYPGQLTDDAFGATAYPINEDTITENTKPLNTAYYHRWFQVQKTGAMGQRARHRGFSDSSVFMAMTSNPQVVEAKTTHCKWRTCNEYSQRWTYAIPLEIIFLTPLSSWNPYNITYRGINNSPEGKVVTFGKRNGMQTKEKAFNGVNSMSFYRTPFEFFQGDQVNKISADTARKVVGVLDAQGNLRRTSASGIRAIFPNIPDVGYVRQRYPIMPIHQEGSTIWKELDAIKDLVLNRGEYGYMYHDNNRYPTDDGLVLQLDYGDADHTHLVYLRRQDVEKIHAGMRIWVDSEPTEDHHHHMVIFSKQITNGSWLYKTETTMMYPAHGHARELIVPSNATIVFDEL